MLLLPRLRLALARRPWIYWLFVAGCVAIVWSTLTASQAELADQRRRWGETGRVWVAAVDIAPGDLVRGVARDYPLAMLPARAIDDEPMGVIATTAIAEGEVLVESDVDGTDDNLLPPDWVVFALDRDDTPALHPGSAVVVFGSGQRWCDGVVVAVNDEFLEIGVPPTCADAVSVQVAGGMIVLAAGG
ncbi:MAG: SAF domain-containing protein [Ilumatobacteraceae bacterium]